MILTFRHKGLRDLFERGDTKGVNQALLKRLRVTLARLDAAGTAEDMNLPGLRLHALKGDLRGLWSVTVSGNWRLVFRFVDGDAYDVDLLDYH
jgi:toxin HigB-1